MNATSRDQIILLHIQNTATFLYIISLLISILLTDYEKKELQKRNPFLSKIAYRKLSIFNRTFVIALTIVYLYINYASKDVSSNNKSDIESFRLQITASWLSLIATVIAFYVVVYYQDYTTISGIENPNI